MQVIVLDKHPMDDGRIERHIKYLLSKNIQVIRIHLNRSDLALSPGPFSQFGEKGCRINIAPKSISLKNNPVYFNFFCFSPLITFRVNKAIKSIGIDTTIPTIIHVHDPAFLYLATSLKKAYFEDAKIVYDRHEVYETPSSIWGIKLPKLARVYEIRARDHIDGVISVSEVHNIPIRTLFPKAKVDAVPNYPSIMDYDRKKIINKIENFENKGPIKLMYVGSLANGYDRDIDLLLTIYEEALRSYPNITCCIGGRCNDQTLENKFANLKRDFGDRFEYLGEIPRSYTVDLTERSHIGFLLVKPETTYWVRTSPNKVYEYLICGAVPVIRADVDHSQMLASCSLMFSRDTSQGEIVREVVNLLEDPTRLKTMMENALVLSSNFVFEAVGTNYVNMYETLTSHLMNPLN
jgi:glycosyltransferase involved in cell wall biosynthesis